MERRTCERRRRRHHGAGHASGEATVTATSVADDEKSGSVVITVTDELEVGITAGGTGGIYHPLGAAYAHLIDAFVPSHVGTVHVSNGSLHNLERVLEGQHHFGFTLADSALATFTGTAFDGTAARDDLRTVVLPFTNALHIITTTGTGIVALADLEGKVVSIGAEGSGTEAAAMALLAANGMTVDGTLRMGVNQTVDALRDGTIDAGFWSGAVPTGALTALAEEEELVLVPLTVAEVDAVRAISERFVPYTFAPSNYDTGVEVEGVGIPNLLVALRTSDDELVYEFTRSVFQNIDLVQDAHPTAQETLPERAVFSPLPLHAGALRYYREIGIAVPLALDVD